MRFSPRLFSLCTTLSLLAASSLLDAQPRYLRSSEIRSQVDDLAKAHGDRLTVRTIGKTASGRELWVATIGAGKADSHPAVLVVGGIDGASPVGGEMALRFIREITTNRSDSVRRLLERTTFYVIPCAGPDALEQYFDTPRYERDVNAVPADDDRDGDTDEDGYDDLDGNGVITMMRVRASGGRFIADSADPRAMRPADAARGERGIYDLYSEGRDNDGDRSFNEDPPGGVDINRNFSYNYPHFKSGAGIHAVSSNEARALADFCYDHQNIAAVVTFAPQNNLMNPWETKPGSDGAAGRGGGRIARTVREEDQEEMKRIAEIFKASTGFRDAPAYEKGEGAFAEWAYYHYGRYSFGTSGWWMPKIEPPKGTKDSSGKEAEGGETKGKEKRAERKASTSDTLQWLTSQGIEKPFVEWRRVEHPDFPDREVEVGGFVPFIRSNPPAAMLDSLGAAHARFITFLGALLPRLEWGNLRTERLAAGVHRVSLELVNTGFLPTISSMGGTSRVPLDVKVELDLARGQSVATGRRVQLLGAVDGSGGMKELSWVVTGSGTVTIRVAGPMVGELVERVELR